MKHPVVGHLVTSTFPQCYNMYDFTLEILIQKFCPNAQKDYTEFKKSNFKAIKEISVLLKKGKTGESLLYHL